jgi:hypothetical protein
MPDPVSWLLIEAGWAVLDREGEQFGKVNEVLGDTERDIFDGLAASPSVLATPRYVPAERVGTIFEGEVHLDLSREECDALDEYTG